MRIFPIGFDKRPRHQAGMRLAASVLLSIAAFGCRAQANESAVSVASVAATAQEGGTPGFVWWEAENPKNTNFPPTSQSGFAPASEQEAAVLSGDAWIAAGGDRTQTLFLEYDVTVPKNGDYMFYARKFWHHGPFRYRFDALPWQEVRKTALLDDAPLRQFVGANWVPAGTVALKAGKHTLRIELLENKGAAAFDAFVLTTTPFTARGRMKPGEKYNRAPVGWFPFEPDPDTFAPTALDLRSLNEKFAGENGFIQARGEEFIHGKTGKPVRFWAINTGGETVTLDKASVDYMARSLAKSGVNLIRIHGGIWGEDFRQVDREHLSKLQYFITAMKREGIYSCLSIYFPLWIRFDDKSPYAGYPAGGKNPFALLFFNKEFQAVYRDWWKALLTTPNPHAIGNIPLRDDPAVAMVEIVNEDSYLFWTFTPYENIPGPQMAILEKQFGDYLTKKYGSVPKALTAWGGAAVRGDDAGAGRAGFMPLYDVFNRKNVRAQDTAAFLTESQKTFFTETQTYIKKDLGYKSTVYASNWITANGQILGPLDKYSNTVADFMDRHGYFGGPHTGERAGYSVSAGDKFRDRSALLFTPNKEGDGPDFSLPIMDIRYNNKPSTISEVNWTPPNRFRADLPLLSAAYGLLQGTDAFFFFATASPSWESMIGKFSLRTPVIFGQFPAAALIYRKGLVKPAAPVVDVNLKLADLFALQGAPVSAPVNLDELRAKDIPAGRTVEVPKVSALDPLSFLVGKVAMTFSEAGGASRVADLSQYIDREAKVVRSQTGELAWNWGAGRMAMNAPQAQGVTGFLAKAGAVRLKDVTIDAGMEYGAVVLVALDNQPIARSARMLLQVMSEDANYGFDAPGTDMREIKNVGTSPLVVRKLSGTITLRRADAAALTVTALDFNGYKDKAVGTAKSLTLQENTLYYLIEK